MTPKHKILIIDDDEGILDSTRVVLEEFGYRCVTLNRVDDVYYTINT